jgi:hypothetical protein
MNQVERGDGSTEREDTADQHDGGTVRRRMIVTATTTAAAAAAADNVPNPVLIQAPSHAEITHETPDKPQIKVGRRYRTYLGHSPDELRPRSGAGAKVKAGNVAVSGVAYNGGKARLESVLLSFDKGESACPIQKGESSPGKDESCPIRAPFQTNMRVERRPGAQWTSSVVHGESHGIRARSTHI